MPKLHVELLSEGVLSILSSKANSKSTAVPKKFPAFKFSDSVEILKLAFEYMVEIAGTLHVATLAEDRVSSIMHFSSQTEI